MNATAKFLTGRNVYVAGYVGSTFLVCGPKAHGLLVQNRETGQTMAVTADMVTPV